MADGLGLLQDPEELLRRLTMVSDEDRAAAKRAALMQAGLAMMAGRGNAIQNIGMGGMAGLNAYHGMLQGSQESALNKVKLYHQLLQMRQEQEKQQQQVQERARQEQMRTEMGQAFQPFDAIGRFQDAPDSPPPVQQQGGVTTYPLEGRPSDRDISSFARGVEQQATQYPADLQKRIAGVFGRYAPEKLTADMVKLLSPAERKAETNIEKLIVARDRLPPGDPNRALYDKMIEKEVAAKQPDRARFGGGGNVMVDYQYDPERKLEGKRHPTNPDYVEMGTSQAVASVHVSPTMQNLQESAQSKVVGEGLGKMRVVLNEDEMKSHTKLAQLERMEQLLQGVDTGRLTPAFTEVAGIAQSFGITLDPKLAEKDAATSLSREMALQARNPAGGAGMPGAMSDDDRRFLQSIVPGLAQTSEGRRLIIDTNRKLAKRSIEIARIARKYAQDHGGVIDDGIYEEFAKFANANPLFPKLPTAPATRGGGGFTIQRTE